MTETSYGEIMEKLKALCPCPSVTGCDEVKNGRMESAVYYTDRNGEVKRYATEKIEGAFHGAGDVYVSALVGALARGIAPDTAVAIAAEFTKDSIKQTALDKTEARYGLPISPRSNGRRRNPDRPCIFQQNFTIDFLLNSVAIFGKRSIIDNIKTTGACPT